MNQRFWFTVITLSLLALGSCSDPTQIGLDLLEEDQVVTESVSVAIPEGTTVLSEELQTYSPFSASQLRSYLVGSMTDPVFGQTEATIYAEPRPGFPEPDFTSARLDSIVLVLPYDSTGWYGDTDDIYQLDVFRLTENFERTDYFSNQSFAVDPVPISEPKPFRPTMDSLEVNDFSFGGEQTISFPHLRIPLKEALGEEFMAYDSTAFQADSAFLAVFKGIQIRAATQNRGVLSFDLVNSTQGGIYLYYTRNDTLHRQFQFWFDDLSIRTVQYDHSYRDALVADFVETELDSLLFAQGAAGLNARITIPDLPELEDVVINKAELEFSIADLAQDPDSPFDPVRQFLLSSPDEDGELGIIEDVSLVFARGLILENTFGGVVTAGADGQPDTYRMNISAHMQRVVDGVVDPQLYLTILRASERVSRVALYGPGHPIYPPRLRVIYTRQR